MVQRRMFGSERDTPRTSTEITKTWDVATKPIMSLPPPLSLADDDDAPEASACSSASSTITKEDMEQLITDLQESGSDLKNEEGNLLLAPLMSPSLPQRRLKGKTSDEDDRATETSTDLVSLFQDSAPVVAAKPFLKERPSYLIPEDNDLESDGSASPTAWLDLACFTDATELQSESEDENMDNDEESLKKKDSAADTDAPSSKNEASSRRKSVRRHGRRLYPQIPVRASKRLKSNGEGKWLEERAITHFILSPYDASLDLLSLVE